MEISKQKFISMLTRMAQHGTAPDEGCSIFGVGYEHAYERLKKEYLEEQFSMGISSEKFIVGPFGSGKTHFLRHLMEIARDIDCVTSEVQLNKALNFTDTLQVYGEVIQEIKTPESSGHGIRALLHSSVEKVKKIAGNIEQEIILHAWISGIDEVEFKLDIFKKVIKKALIAILEKDEPIIEMTCQWLNGDINNKDMAKELRIPQIEKKHNNLYAKKMMLSLFQFIKHVGFQGTVVCFDEADIGLNVDKKKSEKILEMLRADIDAITDLNGGAVFIVYALTPTIIEKMMNYAALQQRVSNPFGKSFMEGNTLGPLIDLSQTNQDTNLILIGEKFVELFYKFLGNEISILKEDVTAEIQNLTKIIIANNIGAGNRRDMVKVTCSMLLGILKTGNIEPLIQSDDIHSILSSADKDAEV